MKINNLFVVILLFALFSCVTNNQANKDVEVPSDWAEYKLNNSSFSIKVPPTIELRTNNDSYSQELKGIAPQLVERNNRIAFQQKGLAFKDPDALKRFARFLILYYTEYNGSFPKSNERTDLLLSKQDIDDIIDGELVGLGKDARAYNISYGNEVINGNQAFIIHYTRTGAHGASPVKCKICFLFNNKHFVKMIYSYREAEADIWANDFEKSLQTFRWLN